MNSAFALAITRIPGAVKFPGDCVSLVYVLDLAIEYFLEIT